MDVELPDELVQPVNPMQLKLYPNMHVRKSRLPSLSCHLS